MGKEDSISKQKISLVYLIFIREAKTKLAILAFLCCGEFVLTVSKSPISQFKISDAIFSSNNPLKMGSSELYK